MKRLTNYGFTLIELLVVIAIIGILAAVVLTSLGGAQEGAQNSNVQQTLGSIRSSAQLYYNNNSFSYDDVCGESTSNEISETLDGLAGNLAFITDYDSSTAQTNADGSNPDIVCNDSATEYVVSAPLLNADNEFWCVDSTGYQGGTDNAVDPTSDTACTP